MLLAGACSLVPVLDPVAEVCAGGQGWGVSIVLRNPHAGIYCCYKAQHLTALGRNPSLWNITMDANRYQSPTLYALKKKPKVAKIKASPFSQPNGTISNSGGTFLVLKNASQWILE